MSIIEPEPNPETVEVLLDTAWRIASVESSRTEALDRKASAVATFASVVAALTATLGVQLVEQAPGWWTLALFLTGLGSLLGAVGLALEALRPREYLTLGIAYIKRFPTWSEILKPPDQVRGETMRTLIETIVIEREANQRKIDSIRRSFSLLLVGLVLVAGEGATLAIDEVIG